MRTYMLRRDQIPLNLCPACWWSARLVSQAVTSVPSPGGQVGGPLTTGPPVADATLAPGLGRMAGVAQLVERLGWSLGDVGSIPIPRPLLISLPSPTVILSTCASKRP